MLFKSFSQLSRHASLAKSLWTTSSTNPSSQPPFFASTHQLHRHQSQVATRNPTGFGKRNHRQGSSKNAYTSACAGLTSSSNFSTAVNISSLDDDRQQREFSIDQAHSNHPNLLLQNQLAQKQSKRRFSTTLVTEQIDSNTNNSNNINVTTETKDTKPTQRQIRSKPSESNKDQQIEKKDDPETPHVNSLLADEQFSAVLDVFDHVRQTRTPGVSVYNAALKSTVELCNNQNHELAPMLDLYEQMLEDGVIPNLETYTTIITGLLSAAHDSQSGQFLYSQRGVLESIDHELEKNDQAEQYLTLALHIFNASNSVVWQKYDEHIYKQLFDACEVLNNDVSSILESYENCGYEIEKVADKLIQAYGKTGNIDAAFDIYQQVEQNDKNSSAMVSAYFDALDQYQAVSLIEEKLKGTDFINTLGEVIKGFARTGETSVSWEWIKHAESDKSIPALDEELLGTTFGYICDHNDINTANYLFDYMASVEGFNNNIVRSNYINLLINNGQDINKAVRECQLRGGVWDPATVVKAFEQLSKENLETACQVFIAQSNRSTGNISQKLGQEMLKRVVELFKGQVPFIVALNLSSSPYISAKVFYEQYGVDILNSLWENSGEYNVACSGNRLVTLDIVVLHNIWIKSAMNSIGGVSIAEPMLSTLKEKYQGFVNDLINQGTMIESSFADEVRHCLQALNLASDQWMSFVTRPRFQQQDQQPQETTITKVNIDASNKCIGYCQVKNGAYKAFGIYESALIKGELLAPEAVYAVIDTCGATNKKLLNQAYQLALKYLPSSSSSSQAWTLWVTINRRIVQHLADKDYKKAQEAYLNLKEIGSCPDATGYGHLISHAPVNSTHDEATDAVHLFNESRLMGVVPNTFLYNVLLSKLSKARRLREAVGFFHDMTATGTKKSSITYGTMISACCRAGDEEFARNLFDEMESCENYIPRVAPFNIMLQHYIHAKRDRQAAVGIYQRLLKSKISPSAHTYKLLIDMYSTIEPIDIESADEILEQIVKDKNQITTQHYAALLFARGVGKKDLAAAKEFYSSMTKNNRVHPDKLIFQALLECYVVNNAVEQTGQVLQDMMKFNVDLNAYMANILIRGWAPVNLAKSVGLFDYIYQQKLAEPSSFEAIIRAFLYHGDYQSAANVLETMEDNMYPEPVVSKVRMLLNGFANDPKILLDSIFRQDAHRLVV